MLLWVFMTVLLLVACGFVWQMAKRRELRKLVRQHGSLDEALRHFDPNS
jgi:cytochrome c-type biogenesis protein CcmH/NrfF